MSVEKFTLPNNLDVYVDHMPGAYNTAVYVLAKVGGIHETRADAGKSHCLEHCLFLGTRDFATYAQRDAYADEHAMYANAYTTNLHTAYYNHGPAIEPMFRHLSQITLYPTFPPKRVAGEMDIIRQEAERYRSNYAALHYRAANDALFGLPHSQPVIGYTGEIDYTADELHEHWRRHYVSQNMALVAVGSITRAEAEQLAAHYFAEPTLDRPYTKPAVASPAVSATSGSSGLEIPGYKSLRYNQAVVFDPEMMHYYRKHRQAMSAAMAALSGRTFSTLRGRENISYGGYAYLKTATYPHAMGMMIDVETTPNHLDTARKCFDELFATGADQYSDQALRAAIGEHRGRAMRKLDDVRERADGYVRQLSTSGRVIDSGRTVERIEQLQIDEVREALRVLGQYLATRPRHTHITADAPSLKGLDVVYTIPDVM